MHGAALRKLGLAAQWRYGAIDVEAGDFESLVRSLPARGYAGANVTVPHKLAALAVAGEASPAAREIGAANTLSFVDGRIAAENTDAVGLLEALPSDPRGKRALVLGAGGSGRAAVWALTRAGAAVRVWNRTRERAEGLVRAIGGGARACGDADATGAGFDLLVNCTTVGLAATNPEAAPGGAALSGRGGPTLKSLPIAADAIHAGQEVVDLIYGSVDTQLIATARARGATPVDGVEVLVRQGAASLRLWTGLEPPLEAMRRAARG